MERLCPHHQTIHQNFAKHKSDLDYAKEYPFGFPETPEAKTKRHKVTIHYEMRKVIKDGYFVVPGHTFGTISQGALALKDVFRGPKKDFRKMVSEVEADAVLLHGSMEKYFKATQCAFIRKFPDRVAKESCAKEDRDP